MSDVSQPGTPQRSGSDFTIFIVIAIIFLGGLWMLGGRSETPLAKSAAGMQGLVSWLRTNDVEVISFEGGGRLTRGQVGLRILPLYDTDLENPREQPETRAEVIGETSEYDMDTWVYGRKIRGLPTLVVLPKWRAGMRKLGVAHKDLLIPEVEMNRLLRQIGLEGGRIGRDAAGWTARIPRSEGMDLVQPIGTMHTQYLRAGGDCAPILGRGELVLLAECRIIPNDDFYAEDDDQTHFHLLTDPDLLSNHGLQWAGNGQAALKIVEYFEPQHPVVLDLTNRYVTVEPGWGTPRHERTWDDFARMFRWPFTMIWIAFAALGGLVLWRAAKRYGPLARVYADEPGASKTIAIDAKARLLRMANHDAALLGSHVQARLAHLASELLGPHRPADQNPLAVLTRLIGRRNPELATELAQAADMASAPADSPNEIIRRLDRFETCYDKVSHEFGRATEPR